MHVKGKKKHASVKESLERVFRELKKGGTRGGRRKEKMKGRRRVTEKVRKGGKGRLDESTASGREGGKGGDRRKSGKSGNMVVGEGKTEGKGAMRGEETQPIGVD